MVIYLKEDINYDEYNLFIYSLETIHPYIGFQRLEEFYDNHLSYNNIVTVRSKEELLKERAKIKYSPLVNSELLNLPLGGSYLDDFGGAALNDNGVKFCKYIMGL